MGRSLRPRAPLAVRQGVAVRAPNSSVALGYSSDELASVPDGANLGLGCGNPQAMAALRAGETVLDLGSGAGFDCFLAASQVGPTGQAIGVDMTPQMVAKARDSARRAGVDQRRFPPWRDRAPPGPGRVRGRHSVQLRDQPLTKQGRRNSRSVSSAAAGRTLAISDVVATAPIPERLRGTDSALTDCIGGAAHVDKLERMLTEAGFAGVAVRPRPESREFTKDWMPGTGIEEYVASATVEAVKPAAVRSCCGPECCTPGATQ